MQTDAVVMDRPAKAKKRALKKMTVNQIQDRIYLLSTQDKIYLCKELKSLVTKEIEEMNKLAESAKEL